jgi:hypothetical protein
MNRNKIIKILRIIIIIIIIIIETTVHALGPAIIRVSQRFLMILRTVEGARASRTKHNRFSTITLFVYQNIIGKDE